MKKWIAILLCALLLLAAAACTKKTETEAPASVGSEDVTALAAGGWAATEDPALTDAQKAVFEKALQELVGVDYTPIACLGTQVVAGTNYCFLTQSTVVYPGATPKYALVYVYADLQGNAEIMNIADMPIIPNDDDTVSAPEEQLMGGWSYAEAYEITDELQGLLDKALEGLVGASYKPVAELGTQVVAGLNHCMLCQVTPVVPNAVPHYALVYIYQDLSGGAELSKVIDLDVGALCTYGA